MKQERVVLLAVSLAVACSSGDKDGLGAPVSGLVPSGITFRRDVTPVTDAAAAEPGVFIPPYLDCRPPRAGDATSDPSGEVCTHVSIAGCTEEGKYFPDYASCDVVRTQRPFWRAPPANEPQANDPRLGDAAFMGELAWVTSQIGAAGCACCHDSRVTAGMAAQWDISKGPIWLDTLSDTGLALFAGLADSSVLGAYPAEENHGFDRTRTGIPTTDTARMKAFTLAELARRGISEDQARTVPPFGGPIYENAVRAPVSCGVGEGVGLDGTVTWRGGKARYVYVLAEGSSNPGVPPNLDLPSGTLFRLDVLASADGVESGITYGTTPPGTFQAAPDMARAPALQIGTRYQLTVLLDVGVPLANCIFTYGQVAAPVPAPGAGGTPSGGACSLPGGDAAGFGATCTDGATSTDCPCEASYCAVQPGQTAGYCTRTGCKEDASICPSGWSCLDLSVFLPGQPSICRKP